MNTNEKKHTTQLQKNKDLIVFIPGLFNEADEPLFVNAESFFKEKGYAVHTINPYNKTTSDAVTLDFLLDTLENTIDDLLQNGNTLYFVGHSFGALLILLLQQERSRQNDLHNLVLWDPSFLPVPADVKDDFFTFENNAIYIKDDEDDIAINNTFFNELTNTTIDDFSHSDSQYIGIFFAAQGSQDYFFEKYKKIMPRNTEFVTIAGADHIFSKNEHQAKLFEGTLSFLTNSHGIDSRR